MMQGVEKYIFLAEKPKYLYLTTHFLPQSYQLTPNSFTHSSAIKIYILICIYVQVTSSES